MEELLINLILEGKVEGRIDQVGMRLELDKKCVVVLVISEHTLTQLLKGKSWRSSGTTLSRNGQMHWRVFTQPWLERTPVAEPEEVLETARRPICHLTSMEVVGEIVFEVEQLYAHCISTTCVIDCSNSSINCKMQS